MPKITPVLVKLQIKNLRMRGWKFREIASELNIPISTVNSILNIKPKILKPIEQLKVLNQRKRIALSLPMNIDIKSGGRDFLREIVRQRDKCTCQICKKIWQKGTRRFDVHHLDENISGKIDSRLISLKYDRENMDKLITLCHKCHLNLHYGNVALVDNRNNIPILTV